MSFRFREEEPSVDAGELPAPVNVSDVSVESEAIVHLGRQVATRAMSQRSLEPAWPIRFWPILAFAAVTLLGGLVTTLKEPLTISKIEPQLKRDIVLARAAGVPLTWNDAGWTDSSPQNGARIIAEACDEFQREGEGSKTDLEKYFYRQGSGVATFATLNRHAVSLRLAEDASSSATIQFPPAEIEGVDGIPVELQPIITDLCVRADMNSKYGNQDLALEDLRAATKLVDLIRVDSAARLEHVNAIEGVVFLALERFIDRNAGSPKFLQAGKEAALSLTDFRFNEALVGQAYEEMLVARNSELFRRRGNSYNPSLMDQSVIPKTGAEMKMLDTELRDWTALFRALPGKDYATTDRLLVNFDPSHVQDLGRDGAAFQQWLPSLEVAYRTDMCAIATGRSVAALADVLAYRQAHGKLPARLSDATKSPVIDPFTGAFGMDFGTNEMLYFAEPGNIRIYSCGPSGQDLGGFRRHELSGPRSQRDYNYGASDPPFAADPAYAG